MRGDRQSPGSAGPVFPAPPPPEVIVQAPIRVLAMITVSGTLGIHIFVPALALAAVDLHADDLSMRLTIGLYIFGLAVGQLFYGPISDRFGRRATLIAGLALFAVAGIAAACAATVGQLIAARFAQSLGGCSGLVLARAIIRDGASSDHSVRRLAALNLIISALPGLAPLVGGLMVRTAGWRAPLLLLAALGLANIVMVLRHIVDPERAGSGPTIGAVLARSGRLARGPRFLVLAVAGGCATTAMYAFISAAPFIFVRELHLAAEGVGVYLALVVAGLWVGSLIASRLAGRVALLRLLTGAVSVSMAGAILFLAVGLSGRLSVAAVLAPMILFTLGAGVAAPVALTEALAVDPASVGAASGLYGFIQMTIGAACTALGGLGPDAIVSVGATLVGASLLSQLLLWVSRHAVRRSAGIAPTAPCSPAGDRGAGRAPAGHTARDNIG